MKIETYHQICFIFCMAIFAYIVGCSTLRSNAKQAQRDTRVVIDTARTDAGELIATVRVDVKALATDTNVQMQVLELLIAAAKK